MIEEHSGPAWTRVQLARHPERPYAMDYIARLAAGFQELRGDRLVGEDRALVGGLGRWRGRTVLFLGQQKGRCLADRIERNFGMLHPEGIRKAMRLARLAAKFRLPIVSLIDTPGAYPGTAAEERGIASAIGAAIMEWFQVRTPVVAVIIGEGGSGGALALAVADRVLMLENAIYSVAAPEACASIVWRDSAHKHLAAEELGLTADRLHELGLVDDVVPEPAGGAHLDHDEAARLLDAALAPSLAALRDQPVERLLRRRYERFRTIGSALPTRG